MVTRRRLLLFIRLFMLFVHYDQPQMPERQEDGRTNAYNNIVRLFGQLLLPNLDTFGIRKLGMVHAHTVTEYAI